MIECPSCHADNADGNRFCTECGASLVPPPCHSCGAQPAPGAAFCTQCGADLRTAPGAVVDGEWLRGGGEWVRRLDADQLQRTGWLPEALGAAVGGSVRVPDGCLGVLRVDGRVRERLRPGWQGTPGWLADLKERGLRALLRERTVTVHLVDDRPVPLQLVLPHHGGDQGHDVRATVLVSVDPGRLDRFLDRLVGDAASLSIADLQARLRPAAEEALTDALAAHGPRWSAAGGAMAQSLRSQLTDALGLRIEVRLRPVGQTHRADLHLAGQGDPPLITADGHHVSFDLALVATGRGRLPALGGPLRAAAARAVRALPLAQAEQAVGALAGVADTELDAHGLTLEQLVLVDLAADGGAWQRGARADMDRARERLEVERERLGLQGDEDDVRALALALARRQAQTDRDHARAERAAAAADAEANDQLAAREEALARAQAERAHADALAAHGRAAEMADTVQRHQADAARADATLQAELARQRAETDAHVKRVHDQAQLDKLTAMAALDRQMADAEHQRKLQSMEAMAGRSEAEILALQATELAKAEHGAAFADALGKLADGQAAAKERARADEQLAARDAKLHDLAMAALGRAREGDAAARDAHAQAAQSATETAKATMTSHATVAAAAAGATKACVHCGATLPAAATFCGACGNRQ